MIGSRSKVSFPCALKMRMIMAAVAVSKSGIIVDVLVPNISSMELRDAERTAPSLP